MTVPYNKDCCIWGSILGSPYLGKLAHMRLPAKSGSPPNRPTTADAVCTLLWFRFPFSFPLFPYTPNIIPIYYSSFHFLFHYPNTTPFLPCLTGTQGGPAAARSDLDAAVKLRDFLPRPNWGRHARINNGVVYGNNGKENGNYCRILGLYWGYMGIMEKKMET